MKRSSILMLLLSVSLFACAKPPVTRPEMALEPLSWWRSVSPQDDLAFKDIAAAARQSLEYYKKVPPETTFSIGPMKVTALDIGSDAPELPAHRRECITIR